MLIVITHEYTRGSIEGDLETVLACPYYTCSADTSCLIGAKDCSTVLSDRRECVERSRTTSAYEPNARQ